MKPSGSSFRFPSEIQFLNRVSRMPSMLRVSFGNHSGICSLPMGFVVGFFWMAGFAPAIPCIVRESCKVERFAQRGRLQDPVMRPTALLSQNDPSPVPLCQACAISGHQPGYLIQGSFGGWSLPHCLQRVIDSPRCD